MAKLRAAGPRAKHSLHLADLSSIVQTRSMGERIAATEPRIDVLINNAGAVSSRRRNEPRSYLCRAGLALPFLACASV